MDNIKSYLKKPYARVFLLEEDGGYSASILEFPGCISEGDTIEDANVNLEEAAYNWLKASLEKGLAIPPPSKSVKEMQRIAKQLPPSLKKGEAVSFESLEEFIGDRGTADA